MSCECNIRVLSDYAPKPFVHLLLVFDSDIFQFLSVHRYPYLTLYYCTTVKRCTLELYRATLCNYAIPSSVTVWKVANLRSATTSLACFAFKSAKSYFVTVSTDRCALERLV